MGRTIEVSGHWMMYLWYASVLGIVPVIVHIWVLPFDDWRSVLGVVVSALVILVTVAHVWHLKSDEGIERAITTADFPYGLSYDPGSPQYESNATGDDDDED